MTLGEYVIKKYPGIDSKNGIPKFCPKLFENSGCQCEPKHKSCDECEKEFWSKEI